MLPIVRNVIFIAAFAALVLGVIREAPSVMHDAGIAAPQSWGLQR